MNIGPTPHLTAISAVIFVLAGLIIIVLTVRRPAIGIALLFSVIPFGFEHDVGPTTISVPKVALVAVIAALLLRRTSLAPLAAPGTRRILAGAVALVVISTIATIPSAHHGAAVRETLKAMEYLAFFCAGALALSAEPDTRPLAAAIDIATALVCLSAFREIAGDAHSAILVGSRTVPRIAGVLEGPNQLSAYLDVVGPLLLARAFAGERRRAACFGVAIAGFALVLTLSRAGIASAFIAFVVVALHYAPTRAAVIRVLAASTTIGGLAVAALVRRGGMNRLAKVTESDTLNGLATREELWRAAVAIWKSHPLLGVGPANYELSLSAVGLLGVRTHANNVYLEALADGGPLLLAATIYVALAPIVVFARSRLTRHWIVVGASAASVALALHQTVDDVVFYPKVGDVWWLILGAGAAMMSQREPRTAGSCDVHGDEPERKGTETASSN